MPQKLNFKKKQTYHSSADRARRRRNVALFQEALKISKDISLEPRIKQEGVPSEISVYDLMEIAVEPVDCLDSIANYVREFPSIEGRNRVVMLNMACFSTPGGGVTRGSSAQEEALCRASNLYPNLVEARKFGFYPMDNGFVTRDVTFFRGADGEIRDSSSWATCDILNMAAWRFRTERSVSELSQKEKNVMYGKIQEILYLSQGYDCVILSAFGCGAYHNPPDLVAEMFYQLLVEEGWGYKFQKVVFAIINDRNGRSNFEVFRDRFSDK